MENNIRFFYILENFLKSVKNLYIVYAYFFDNESLTKRQDLCSYNLLGMDEE